MGEARDVMNSATRASLEGDIPVLKSLYAEDAVVETPDRGTLTGRDEIGAYFEEFLAAFSELSWEPVHEYEAGDTAVDEGYVSGTNTGPLATPGGEIPATGKRIRIRSCDLVSVESGLIKSHRLYFDQMGFLEQLGLADAGQAASAQ